MKKSFLEQQIRAEILADPNFQVKQEAHIKRMTELQLKLNDGRELSYED
jgi:hypothetical protein